MEKLIIHPKHIEFQILADKFGNVIHLGGTGLFCATKKSEDDGGMPLPYYKRKLRTTMGNAAVKAAKATGYKCWYH